MQTCFECGDSARHNHHVVPRVRGGTKTVPLCRSCHAAAHGEHGEAPQGFLPAHPAALVSLAAEMYESGWTLKQLAAFFNAAGVRQKPYGANSFSRAFDRLGVARRRKGPQGKIRPAHVSIA